MSAVSMRTLGSLSELRIREDAQLIRPQYSSLRIVAVQ